VELSEEQYKNIIKAGEQIALASKARIDEENKRLTGFKPSSIFCAKNIKKIPPPREWAWDFWMPTGSVTGLSGSGGVGKSTLAQQIATHKAIGKSYLNCSMAKAPALYLTCEDSQEELERRQFAINKGLNISMRDLSNLHLWSRIGEDSLLVNLQNNIFCRTQFFNELDEHMARLQLKMLFLDLIPDYWNGNEIMRQQVNVFVKTQLGYLANKHKCAVIGLYHPSQSGKNSGTGESGSTAWDGSFRSRIYFNQNKDSGERSITRMKSNYSGSNEGKKVVWDDGYFSEADKIKVTPAEQMDEYNKNAFMQIMEHCKINNIDVSPAVQSINYFAKIFPLIWREMDKRHAAISSQQFKKSMTQLQFANRVEITPGSSRKRPRIIISKL